MMGGEPHTKKVAPHDIQKGEGGVWARSSRGPELQKFIKEGKKGYYLIIPALTTTKWKLHQKEKNFTG